MPEVVLPINNTPTIGSYWFYADLLCIISNVDKENAWELNNYIQIVNWHTDKQYLLTLFSNSHYRNHMVEYYNCSFLEFQRISKDLIGTINGMNILNFIIKCIDSGKYVLLMVDRYYIREYNISKKSPHELLIYGYDSNKCRIYFCDNDSTGKFSADLSTDFASFERAYTQITPKENHEFNEFIYVVNPKNDPNYKFNISFVKNSIIKYVNGTPEHRIHRMRTTYGIDVYDSIKDYLELLIKKEIEVDIRAFHLLFDHKKCMTKRIKYMIDNSYIEETNQILTRFLEIEKSVLVFRNLLLKYRINEKIDILKTLIYGFEEVKNKEKVILDEIIQQL